MSLLKNLTTDDSIANERDSVGGGVLASDAYPSKVKLAYITTSQGGAMALNLNLETTEGRDIRAQLWMTSGKEKGCKNFYEKDGQKHYLPGFLLAESLALLTVGKGIAELDTEEKVVKLYDFQAKAEVPTKVQMVMELLDKDVIAGVIRQTVDKNVKDANGVYVPSGETRDENEIDKFFRARDGMTTAEIRAQAEKASFIDTWKAKWAGQVRNKAKGAAAGGTAGAPKAGAAGATGTKKPTTSLFA